MPLLFSYGTLQQEGVQRSTFGRLLKGSADALVGYAQTMVKIEDADVVAKSGKTHHPIVAYSGRERRSRVRNRIRDHRRRARRRRRLRGRRLQAGVAPLASGRRAWVYVDARGAADEANG